MVTDDFSFPAMPEPVAIDASSTSLWRVPSGISLGSLHEDDDAGEDEEENSISDWGDTKGRMKDDENNEEEKMDMLWENFNDGELLRRISSPFDAKKGDKEKLFWGSEFESKKSNGRRRRTRSCSSSTALTSPRRQSLVIILKMLKKLLSLQDSLKVPGGLGKTH